MSFESQVKLAQGRSAQQRMKGQVIDRDQYHLTEIGVSVQNHDVERLKDRLTYDDFDSNMTKAYMLPKGYYIKENPRTGETEMFVAGTRTADQWAGNALDAAAMQLEVPIHAAFTTEMMDLGVPPFISEKLYTPYNKSLLYKMTRGKKENELARVAKENNVDVVYGHSRGGALIADAPFEDHVQRVGVDSAMLIAQNKDMINLNEGGGDGFLDNFDGLIGLTGHDNVTVNYGSNVHHAWN